MHAQHIIIYVGIALGLALMTYYAHKALIRALARSYAKGLNERNALHSQRITALNTDIGSILRHHAEEVSGLADQLTTLQQKFQGATAITFTQADHKTLLAVANTLRLAGQTWQAIKGTDAYRVKAVAHAQFADELGFRLLESVNNANQLNSRSLDTRLIEWLDRRGDLISDLEVSSVQFPHDEANPAGYPHIRDALRQAFEQDNAKQTLEFAPQQEDAA